MMKNLAQTSFFERFSSLLKALLMLFGLSTAILLTLWCAGRFHWKEPSVPVIFEPMGEGVTDDQTYDPDVMDPGLEAMVDNEPIQETLQSINDVISLKVSDIIAVSDGLEQNEVHGKKGDGRSAGTGSGGGGRHWEVNFLKGNTLDSYAKQLDFFNIELGVLNPGNKVLYASNFSASKPTVRENNADQEKRYYLTWIDGALQDADKQLLKKAGVSSDDKLILKFLPSELEQKLLGLEAEAAKKRGEPVQATVFALVEVPKNGKTTYDFVVVRQIFK